MLLEVLPTELLLKIISFVGKEYFCRNKDIILVSRQWHQLVRPLLFANLNFNHYTLDRLLQEGSAENLPALMADFTKELDLFLSIRQDDILSPQIEGSPQAACSLDRRLERSLTKLHHMSKGKGIRSLKLDTLQNYAEPSIASILTNRLGTSCILPLLQMDGLTEVRIDLSMYDSTPIPIHTPHIHACEFVKDLPKTIRRLHVSMYIMCPDVLRWAALEGEPSGLEDVIIRLPLQSHHCFMNWQEHPALYSRQIVTSQARHIYEEEARRLASALPNARKVRVLYQPGAILHLHSYDAIRDRRMSLEFDDPWDADGALIEEGALGS